MESMKYNHEKPCLKTHVTDECKWPRKYIKVYKIKCATIRTCCNAQLQRYCFVSPRSVHKEAQRKLPKTWITVRTPPDRLQMHRRLGSHALQKPQVGGEHGADSKLAADMVRTVGRRRTWMFMLQTLFHCVYSTRSDSRSRTWITVRATARSTSNSSTIGKSSPAEAAGRRRTWG